MSEFWVSNKKYFCKYCDIFIADNASSRTQHETGFRHMGNKDRFVRGLYKAGEKKAKDQADEARDMARVDQAAQAAFAADVGAGLAKASDAPVASSSKPIAAPAKPSSPWANYSTAASLGYEDPDAARLKEEYDRKQTQGLAGEWEMLAPVERPAPEDEAAEEAVSLKRTAEEAADGDDARTHKLRGKKMNVGLGELYDPGIIVVKPRAKEEEKAEVIQGIEGGGPMTAAPAATELPKWTPRQWTRPEDPLSSSKPDPSIPLDNGLVAPKDEPSPPSEKAADETPSSMPAVKTEVKEEETVVPAAGSMFRKRKAPRPGAKK